MAIKSSKPTGTSKSTAATQPSKPSKAATSAKAPKKIEKALKTPSKLTLVKAPAVAAEKKKKSSKKMVPGAVSKTEVSKAAKPKKASAAISLDPQTPLIEPVIAHDEISLRAYFIAERRHKMGWPGNSGTDWADALSQLRAEALEKPLKKR